MDNYITLFEKFIGLIDWKLLQKYTVKLNTDFKKNKFFTHEHLASMINFHICEHDGLRDLKQSMTEQMSEILSEISQHCKIKTLMGHSKNAVRIQMITGIITYLLLRLTFEKVEIKISLINLKHKIKNQLFKLVTKM